ncbi:DNA-binding regulatory protein, YebC/PmpR family [Humidesulfovibrio mexicanus]|uniref:Probable transcriptional regulatory protein SAMN04488503_0687 n=1 Tax=Humidesulfovibrio mexicanus TaxID=147047 RepID=A0A238Y596_9BACT|nr:YebC/PmpR family DNA-binding transcriptional regulator [Humidesulfovibrio mexicanus]SNR66142.1 DNA-binding regulatory protein, YebC/PmpR family [Humidesulfovibrio mexicanus]
MSGHSKWATIKRAKAKTDAKKGQVFTKITKDIILAAKGGGDPNMNARLRAVIAKAKSANMPNDKIDQAVKKGTGELAGGEIFEMMYEGYAPGGVAILVEVATDNKNRTIAEVRHIIGKGGGNMGEPGSVAWMFDKRGVLSFDPAKYTEDQVMEVALEAGADDVVAEEGTLEVRVAPENYSAVEKAFEDAGIAVESSELTMLPKNLTPVDAATARKVMNLMENLEENEDVSNVYVTADFTDEIMEELG